MPSLRLPFTPSYLQNQYHLGNLYPTKYDCQHKVQSWLPLELRGIISQISLLQCWSLLNHVWFLSSGWPASPIPAKQWFCISGSGVLSVTASSSTPAGQNYRFLIHSSQRPNRVFKRLSKFPVEFNKPGFYHLHFSQHSSSNLPQNQSQALTTQWLSYGPQRPKVFLQCSPKQYGQVSHSKSPLSYYQSFLVRLNVAVMKHPD